MNAKINLDQDRLQMRSSIISGLDCKATFGNMNTPISTNGRIALKNGKGGTFLPTNGKQVGRWYVRAVVENNPTRPGEKMLQVLAAMPLNMNSPLQGSGSGSFVTDPLNKNVVYDWNNSKSKLLQPEAPLCESYFSTSPALRCETNKKLVGIDHKGLPICVDHNTSDCGTGRKAVGMDSKGELICADNAVASSCPTGQKVQGFNSDGSPRCSTILSSTTCPSGHKQVGNNPDGSAKCALNTSAKNCPSGQKVIGTNSFGELLCGNNSTARTCPYGSRVNGITTKGEVVCVPLHSSNSVCPSHQTAIGVGWDGKPVCQNKPSANKFCANGYAINGLDANSNPVCAKIPPPSDVSQALAGKGNCPDGQLMLGFDANGNRKCGIIESRAFSNRGARGVRQDCPNGWNRTGCTGLCDSSIGSAGDDDNQANGALVSGSNGCSMQCDDRDQERSSNVLIQAICSRITPL